MPNKAIIRKQKDINKKSGVEYEIYKLTSNKKRLVYSKAVSSVDSLNVKIHPASSQSVVFRIQGVPQERYTESQKLSLIIYRCLKWGKYTDKGIR